MVSNLSSVSPGSTESPITSTPGSPCRAVVLWIDWYAYHVARFEALVQHRELSDLVVGLELVGGAGVHQGLTFRQSLPSGLPVETVMPHHNWREVGQLALAQAVWRRLNELNPDCVLVPGYYTAPGLSAALWAKWHRKKSVLMTESTQGDHQRSWSKELFKGALLRSLFDWAIAGGHPHARYLQALGFPAERIGRYYDVVGNDFFYTECLALRRARVAAEFGLPSRYFLYVGRLAPEKNVDGLLEAYCDYRQGGGSWPLVIVGDGPLALTLRARAEACPFAAEIVFAGHKGHRELPPYYAFASCFILPSTREPWGLVVNEAMASGLPVIVSERCGCAEDLVVPGKNGFVFNPAVNGELSGCLSLISTLAPDHLELMGQRSHERISTYSPQNWAAEVARIVKAEVL